MEKERYAIRAVERALDILNCFEGDAEELSILEISQRIGLPKSSVHRFLVTLELYGFLEVNTLNQKYCLGSKIMSLGSLAIRRVKLTEKGYPYWVELSKAVQATVHIVVMNQGEGIYIGKVEDPHAAINSYVGKRVALHCTGVGKVLLSGLSEAEFDALYKDKTLETYTENTITDVKKLKEHVREIAIRGFAIDDEECFEGLRCVAAGVRDYSGRIIAAISVSEFTPRFSKERLPEIIRQVQSTAAKVSGAMGYCDSAVKRSKE